MVTNSYTYIYIIGHDSISLKKWLGYYNSFCHENIHYYDLLGSVSKRSNEISQR